MVTKTYGNLQQEQGATPALRDAVQSTTTPATSSAAITGVSAEGIQAYDSLRAAMTTLSDQLLRTQATAGIVSADIRQIYDISTALIQIKSDPTLSTASDATRLMFLHSQPGSAEQLRAINYQQARLDALIANVVEDSGLMHLGRAAQQTYRAVERLEVYLQNQQLEELKVGLLEIKRFALAPTSTADVEKVLAATGQLCAGFERISESLEKAALKLQGEAPSQAAADYARIIERLGSTQPDALAIALTLEQAGVTKTEFRDTVKLLIRSELPNEQIREGLANPATFKLNSVAEIAELINITKSLSDQDSQQKTAAAEAKVIQLSEAQVVSEQSRFAKFVEAARENIAYVMRVISAPVVAANMALSMARSASAGSISYADFSSKVTALGYSPEGLIFKELAKLLAKWHVIDSTIEVDAVQTNPEVAPAVQVRPDYRLAIQGGEGDDDSQRIRRAAA